MGVDGGSGGRVGATVPRNLLEYACTCVCISVASSQHNCNYGFVVGLLSIYYYVEGGGWGSRPPLATPAHAGQSATRRRLPVPTSLRCSRPSPRFPSARAAMGAKRRPWPQAREAKLASCAIACPVCAKRGLTCLCTAVKANSSSRKKREEDDEVEEEQENGSVQSRAGGPMQLPRAGGGRRVEARAGVSRRRGRTRRRRRRSSRRRRG